MQNLVRIQVLEVPGQSGLALSVHLKCGTVEGYHEVQTVVDLLACMTSRDTEPAVANNEDDKRGLQAEACPVPDIGSFAVKICSPSSMRQLIIIWTGSS